MMKQHALRQLTPIPAPSSILVLATRQIGDVLLTTPLLRSIRRAWPEARLDVAVFAGKGGMLEGNPDIDNVIEFPERTGLWGSRVLIKRYLRFYDLAVNTQAGDRSHLMAMIFARRRVGCIVAKRRSEYWKYLVNTRYVSLPLSERHIVWQHLELAKTLGVQPIPEVVPPSREGGSVGSDAVQLSHPYVVFHLKPQWRYKEVPGEAWRQLVEYALGCGLQVVVTGGEADRRYIAETIGAFDSRVKFVVGKGGFGGLAAILSAARYFVGPDTAVTHLAAVCGTPTLAILGPTNPAQWGPWPQCGVEGAGPWKRRAVQQWQAFGNVVILQAGYEKFDCVPCAKEGCERSKSSHSDCMDSLSGEVLIAGVRRLLDQFSSPESVAPNQTP